MVWSKGVRRQFSERFFGTNITRTQKLSTQSFRYPVDQYTKPCSKLEKFAQRPNFPNSKKYKTSSRAFYIENFFVEFWPWGHLKLYIQDFRTYLMTFLTKNLEVCCDLECFVDLFHKKSESLLWSRVPNDLFHKKSEILLWSRVPNDLFHKNIWKSAVISSALLP